MTKIDPSSIAFDFDGVVADTSGLFVRLAREDYGIEIDHESIIDYDFHNLENLDTGIAAEILSRLTDFPHELELMPYNHAADVLKKLSVKAPLLFVTARPDGAPVYLWFEKTFPFIDKNRIRIEATGSSTAKLEILKKNGIAAFIDDRLDTCKMLADNGVTPLVYDQPWNRHPHDFIVVRDWNDISNLIEW